AVQLAVGEGAVRLLLAVGIPGRAGAVQLARVLRPLDLQAASGIPAPARSVLDVIDEGRFADELAGAVPELPQALPLLVAHLALAGALAVGVEVGPDAGGFVLLVLPLGRARPLGVIENEWPLQDTVDVMHLAALAPLGVGHRPHAVA